MLALFTNGRATQGPTNQWCCQDSGQPHPQPCRCGTSSPGLTCWMLPQNWFLTRSLPARDTWQASLLPCPTWRLTPLPLGTRQMLRASEKYLQVHASPQDPGPLREVALCVVTLALSHFRRYYSSPLLPPHQPSPAQELHFLPILSPDVSLLLDLFVICEFSGTVCVIKPYISGTKLWEKEILNMTSMFRNHVFCIYFLIYSSQNFTTTITNHIFIHWAQKKLSKLLKMTSLENVWRHPTEFSLYLWDSKVTLLPQH